jgi:hypothetical protein
VLFGLSAEVADLLSALRDAIATEQEAVLGERMVAAQAAAEGA